MTVEYVPVTPEVLDLANEIIKEYHPELFGLTVSFVFKEDYDVEDKGRGMVIGHCMKVPAAMRAIVDTEFLIWISAKYYKSATMVQRRALLDHELMHIIIDDDGRLAVRTHDIEEFAAIIGRYGFWKGDYGPVRDAAQLVLFAPIETAPVARTIKDPNKVITDAEFQAGLNLDPSKILAETLVEVAHEINENGAIPGAKVELLNMVPDDVLSGVINDPVLSPAFKKSFEKVKENRAKK